MNEEQDTWTVNIKRVEQRTIYIQDNIAIRGD